MSSHFREMIVDFRFTGCPALKALLKRQEKGVGEDLDLIKYSASKVVAHLNKQAIMAQKEVVATETEKIMNELGKDAPDISLTLRYLDDLAEELDKCITQYDSVHSSSRQEAWPHQRKNDQNNAQTEEDVCDLDPEISHF